MLSIKSATGRALRRCGIRARGERSHPSEGRPSAVAALGRDVAFGHHRELPFSPTSFERQLIPLPSVRTRPIRLFVTSAGQGQVSKPERSDTVIARCAQANRSRLRDAQLTRQNQIANPGTGTSRHDRFTRTETFRLVDQPRGPKIGLVGRKHPRALWCIF